MKRFANFTSGVILFSLASFAAANEVSLGTASGIPGAQVEIPVTIDTNTGGIASVDIDMGFDNSVLSFVSCAAGSELNTSKQAVTCSSPNATTVRLLINTSPAFANPPATAMTTGEMAVITMAIQSGASAPATSNLVASNTDAADTDGTSISGVTFNDGVVNIQAAPAPAISVSPTSATIAAANGSTNTQTFTVTNSGNDDGLLVNAPTIGGTNAANFTVTSNTCPTAAPGVAEDGTCSIVVTFAPNSVASFSATLNITSNGGSSSIALTGAGTAGPAGDITITPASTFDFGELLTGTDSATQVFTATNTGATGSTVTIGSAGLNTLTGSPFSITANTCTNGTELDKDESCAVTVKFEPTSDGEATRTLTVSGTDANSTSVTDSSAMEGTGVTKSIYTSDPAAGASDSEVVGPQGSNDFTITLGNDGNADYAYSAALTSTSASVFSVTAGASGTVTAGGSATVTVNCTLEDTETYEGSVVITVGNDEYTYNYECVGLPPLPVPVDNKWALLLLALMMLMAASFGFRFMARQ